MIDLDKANLASFVDVDKIVEVVQGSFTYSYTTANGGGIYDISNPQPGNLFLPFTIYSIDGGSTYFGDLEGNSTSIPDLLTCVTTSVIRYRWGSYGASGSISVMFKTALLAMDL